MSIYSATITLILVMDPIGNIPMFLSVLRYVEPKKRKKIIIREMFIALGILLLFLFFGKNILHGFSISTPALQIGGGIILFLIALKMIFPGAKGSEEETEKNPLVVPLAVPLVAGPSTMSMLILFSSQYPERTTSWLVALLAAWTVSAVVLTFADFLRKLLGSRILKAIEKLMGLILVTMSIEMLLSGVADFLGETL
jgi:multiple antibiotic resistance protein